MNFTQDLLAEPWRHDFFATLRRFERAFPQKPRIGDAATRRDEFLSLGQDPFMEFPASTIGRSDRDAAGRVRVYAKFLGMLGPQGALPLATTEEAHAWQLARDEAFPRFLDLFNHRFQQFFFRAWADARPIAQRDRPERDRFIAYIGSAIGIGSRPFLDRDSIPDEEKMAYAGLLAPQAKSASRLRGFLAGLFKVEVEVEQFIGMRLVFDPADRTCLGTRHATLGSDALVGASVYSVDDKFRVRLIAATMEQYERFLPEGDRCLPLADAVFLYLGEQFEWDVELALPVGEVRPVRLGSFGRLGWTTWMAPNWDDKAEPYRRDARFHPAERVHRRGRSRSDSGRSAKPAKVPALVREATS